MSEEPIKDYPIREGGFLKQLGGFDIYRSPKLIMAVVTVESERGTRDIRFYRWQLRKSTQSGEEAWKVERRESGTLEATIPLAQSSEYRERHEIVTPSLRAMQSCLEES